MRVVAASVVAIAISAVLAPHVRAQKNAPALPVLTRGATHETKTSDIPGLTAATSTCQISLDASYGFTAENPIQVGGGAMYVMARSMRFLESLRGRAGEGLHLTRLGSFEGPDGTILDVYEVDRAGTVSHLYVDGYRFADPRAPVGFVCGPRAPLAAAGPDPFDARRKVMLLATTLDGETLRPISLDADGSAMHGVVFDDVRLVAKTVAAAAAAGDVDAAIGPREVQRPRFLVVAYPVICGAGAVAPQSVKVMDANGNSPDVIKTAIGGQIQELVHRVATPRAALAVMYEGDLAIPGRVEIRYEACDAAPPAVTLPLSGAAGRIIRRVAGRVPDGLILPAGGAQVRVQVYFDGDGVPHLPTYAGGPASLANAAIDAAGGFRADPPRVNGAAWLQASTIAVAFAGSPD